MRHDRKRNHSKLRTTSFSNNPNRHKLANSFQGKRNDAVQDMRGQDSDGVKVTEMDMFKKKSKFQRSELSGSAHESGCSFDGMIPTTVTLERKLCRGRPMLPAQPCGSSIDQAKSLVKKANSSIPPEHHSRVLLHSKQVTMDSPTESDDVQGKMKHTANQTREMDGVQKQQRVHLEHSLQGSGQSQSKNSYGIEDSLATGTNVAVRNGPIFDLPLESSPPIIDFDNVDLFHCDEEEEIVQNGGRPSDDASFVEIRTLSRRMRSVLTWEKMLGFSSIAGATKFTAMQYKILSIALRTANPDIRLFTYKTLRSTMKLTLTGHCYPKSMVTELKRTNGNCPGTEPEDRPSTEIRLVLPSEWAKLDVSTYPFYADVFENSDRARPDFLSIEDAPIVQQRAISIGQELRLWATYDNAMYPTQLGDVINIPCSKGTPLECSLPEWPEQCDIDTSGVLIKGIVGPMWCVTCYDSQDEVPEIGGINRSENVVHRTFCRSTIPHLPTNARQSGTLDVRKQISTSAVTSDGTISSVHCLPGDVCVLIRPFHNTTPQRSELVCLFIASPLRSAVGLSAERLVWMRVRGGEGNGCYEIIEEASITVTKIPIWVSGQKSRPERPYHRHRQNSGFLDNGERFLLYRMVLYADGFNQHKSLSDSRSVGGCYMLPLGLSVENRRSISAVRVISITPSGENMNDALHMVKQDVVTSCTKGIRGTDPYGRSVRIFVDLVGCFGDFPALTSMMDVKGHTADACCTLCSFSRRKRCADPEILYSVEIHSRRLGYMRFDDRMERLRAFGLDEAMKKRIGVRCDNDADANAVLGISLSRQLKDAGRNVPEYHGRPVLDTRFDSSLSTAAAPDHMFSGLIKNLISLCFDEVCTDELRLRIEIQILDNLKRNSLPFSGQLFKKNKENGFRGLHGHSMSALFCILLCSAPVFYQHYTRTNKKVFDLPRILQEFVAKVYGLYSPLTDGTATNIDDQHRYESDLSVAGRNYVQAAANVCSSLGQKGAVLDKPNAHRSLELCVHTIPNYGHARNCSEMVLEMMHRTFKQWLETNTNADAHITAVERALARDWLGRLYSLYDCWSTADKQERACAELGLRRLILGEESVLLDDSEPEVETFLNDFRASLRMAMREPVLSQLQFNGNSHVTWNASSSWEVAKPLCEKRPENLELFINLVCQEYNVGTRAVKSRFKFYEMMRLVATSKYGRRKRAYPHNTVQIGDGISALVCDNCPVPSTILTAGDGRGTLEMFSVHGLMQGDDNKVWAVVKKFSTADIGMSCINAPYQILSVSKCVRRIGLMHICDDRCHECTQTGTMNHSSSAVDGGKYFVYSRTHGYPPYMG